MSRQPRAVDGFDYIRQTHVAMTPKEWQEMYPPSIYRRRVEDGETFYHRIGGRIAAEAYANIPEDKPCV